MVVRAESPEILLHPDCLGALDSLRRYLEHRVPEVGNVMGFTDLIKRINQVLNTGESPDGLAPASAPPREALSFWDFDSGADSDSAGGEETESAGGATGEPEWGEDYAGADFEGPGFGDAGFDGDRVYSINEIARLLDRASSAGMDRSISAGELVDEFQRLINYEGY